MSYARQPTRAEGPRIFGNIAVSAGAALLMACSDVASGVGAREEGPDASAEQSDVGQSVDIPVDGLTPEWVAEFNAGDALFDLISRQADGLGPLYTRQACSSCHGGALRGSGFVKKMSVVEADGITPAADQSKLAYGHTEHPLTAGGGVTPILVPAGADIKTSLRFGPPILGRGHMEAILDEEILRVEAEQAALGGTIHGRANRVTYTSQPNNDTRFHTHAPGDAVIGRFGLKARIATLDDFTADALQADIGLTSPLRPLEIPNPDGLLDDAKPGVDIGLEGVNHRANYTRLLAIPPRRSQTSTGAELFARVQCATCHTPSMHTRANYPIVALADIDAPVYTDLLLHDMGDGLADGLGESDGQAGPRDWRTAPLIGLRYLQTYLHDGRATTISEAILMHDGNGSEAHDSLLLFQQLSADEHRQLLDFVTGL